MITCVFEKGYKASLRHIVTHAIVEDHGKLLLVKRTGDMLETGKWSLPGGFLNRDETAEQGVLRELKEETGWEGKIISWFRINTNPNRPKEDRQNVAFDFLVQPVKKSGNADAESSKIEWIPIDKLYSFDQFAFDHGESIKLFLDYRKKSFPLPLFV